MPKKVQVKAEEHTEPAIAEVAAVIIEEVTIPMIRPEDRSAKPIVVNVAADQVSHWQSHGWAVKE